MTRSGPDAIRQTAAAFAVPGSTKAMSDQVLKGRWNQIKGELRKEWSKLTHEDVEKVKGDYEQLLGRIQERYGHAKDKVKLDVDRWLARHPVKKDDGGDDGA